MENKKSNSYGIGFAKPFKKLYRYLIQVDTRQSNRIHSVVDKVVNDRLLYLLILVDEEGRVFHKIEEAVAVPAENALFCYKEGCLFRIEQAVYTASTSVVYLHGKKGQEALAENKKYLI